MALVVDFLGQCKYSQVYMKNIEDYFKKEFLKAYNCIEKGQRIFIPDEVLLYKKMENAVFHSYPEIFLQLEGENEFLFLESTHKMSPGDIMVIPSGISHGERIVDSETDFKHIVITPITKELFSIHIGEASRFKYPSISESVNFSSDNYRLFLHVLDSLIRSSNDSRSLHLKKGLELSLFGFLIQVMDSLDSRIKNTDNPLVHKIKLVISQHLSNPKMNIPFISEQVGRNPNYISGYFKKETGTPLMSYITAERMKIATTYLTTTTMAISEVAWSCGFDTPGYFAKIFRQHFNCTPKSYRDKI